MTTASLFPIRTFSYPLNTPRFLYHTIAPRFNGAALPRFERAGTIVVRAGIQGGPSTIVLTTRQAWGDRAGVVGLLLPSAAVLNNLYGVPNPVTGTCSIEFLTWGNRPNPFTFTEVTNLGVAP